MWDPKKHSDQENLQWCWLRAIEWGRWPIFISQVFAPPLLLILNWISVIIIVILLNLFWAVFVRYKYVNINLAYFSVFLVKIKWIISPLFGYYFYFHDEILVGAIALFWPLLIFIIGVIPTTRVGVIQKLFMNKLGYFEEEQDQL